MTQIRLSHARGVRRRLSAATGTNQLIFSAGPSDESHGLLGKIVVTH